MKAIAVLVTFSLTIVSIAAGQTSSNDVDVKEYTENSVSASLLLGTSIRERLSKPIYIASLYSTNRSTEFSEDNPMVMELRIIASDLSHSTLADIWQEGIIVNTGNTITTAQSYEIASFIDLLRTEVIDNQGRFVPGDQLQFRYDPATGTTINLNQTTIGYFEGKLLFPLLLQAWTGKVPPSSGFKKEITGGRPNLTKPYGKYSSLYPTTERIEQIKQAIDRRNRLLELAAQIPSPEPEIQPETNKNSLAEADTASHNTPIPQGTNGQIEQASTEALRPITPTPITSTPVDSLHTTSTPTTSTPTTSAPITVAALPTKSLLMLQRDRRKKQAKMQQELQQYYITISRLIGAFQKYPRTALKKRLSGTVLFSVTATRQGDFTFFIKESSKSKILDRSALNTMAKAKKVLASSNQLPVLPESMDSDVFKFTLPITYTLPAGKRRVR